jgi:NADH-quinone oxidoreductase subunit F
MLIERNPATVVGGEERAAVERAVGRLGLAAGAGRSDLLPLLHAIQGDLGWLPQGALRALADRMDLPFPDVWGVATFYALFRLEPPRGVMVHVCDDVPCRLRGADMLLAALEERYGPARRFTGAAHGRPPEPEGAAPPCPVDWETVPCLGQCEHAPAAVVAGRLCRAATLERIAAAVREAAADA